MESVKNKKLSVAEAIAMKYIKLAKIIKYVFGGLGLVGIIVVLIGIGIDNHDSEVVCIIGLICTVIGVVGAFFAPMNLEWKGHMLNSNCNIENYLEKLAEKKN